MNIFKSKKRQPINDVQSMERGSKNPRIEIINMEDDEDLCMVLNDDESSLSNHQDENEVSKEFHRMSLDDVMKTRDVCEMKKGIISVPPVPCNVARIFEEFKPLIKSFLSIGKEIIELYEKAEHHKELCGYLLQRCNCAMATVQDLKIRKTENTKFFSKKGNHNLFKELIEWMDKTRKFIKELGQLSKFKRLILTNDNLEETIINLAKEFDDYMKKLNLSLTIQDGDEDLMMRKYDQDQVRKVLLQAYGVPDDQPSRQNFLDAIDLVSKRNKEFQKQDRENKFLELYDVKIIEDNEPLLDGGQYQKTNVRPSKRVEKRTSIHNGTDYSFNEFSNIISSRFDQSQIEIRRQVNILKELKNSENLVRFFGVAQENSRYYVVNEWMEYGNLHEYYTSFRDNMDWDTKIRFALDICRGVAYLHECKILHNDIRSENVLIDKNHKAKITNFGLSKKFSELTENVSHILDMIKYMAPEKLFDSKKRVPYDSKCEIYSVGTLLREISELKKPYSDLDKSEVLDCIRKRAQERYYEPFSNDAPDEWVNLVSRAMEYEPTWRPNISDICYGLYNLSEKDSNSNFLKDNMQISTLNEDSNNDQDETTSSTVIIKILSVDDAIREHKSKYGNKQITWDSFKYHSITNLEARYWVGYYYYYYGEDIPELRNMRKEERIQIAINLFKETADKGNPLAQSEYKKLLDNFIRTVKG